LTMSDARYMRNLVSPKLESQSMQCSVEIAEFAFHATHPHSSLSSLYFQALT
jgi:hypothetical protein